MWTILKTRAIYLPISQLLLMPSSPCVGGGFSTTHKPIYILLAHRGHYYNLSFLFLSFFLKKIHCGHYVLHFKEDICLCLRSWKLPA